MRGSALRDRRRWVGLLPLCLGIPSGVGAAELEGIVLENLSGRPVARAQVTLEASHGGAAAISGSTLTDSGGRFVFRSLPGGAYLISARRPGYLLARYGQRRWDGAGSPIVLDPAAHFYAEIRLRRLGVITGQILDENRLGLAGHAVYAYQAGEGGLRMVAGGISDDRGVYRIVGLEPGRYYVRTGPRQLEDGRGLLPTFFGGTTAAAEARLVDVDLDREASGIDIEPLAGRLTRLAGRVVGVLPATVTLYSDTGPRETQTAADGSFQFDELAPGPYQLVALAGSTPARAAWRRLQLGERPAEIVLDLAPLPVLRVRCEQPGGRPADCRRVTVFLRRSQPRERNPLRVEGDQAASVPPGEYQVAAVAPPEYFIHSLRLPPTSRRFGFFEALPGDTLELTVALGARPAGLSGKVLDAEGRPVPGAPVFLSAVDPHLRLLLEGGRSTRADQRGEYRFFGLPPGRYRVFSSFEFPEPAEADWDTLPTVTVTLEEGRSATLELKLVGGL